MEKRVTTYPLKIEERADGVESRTISGYAVVFDKWSRNLGWFREKVDERALNGVDLSEVVATFNHSFDNVLARVDSNTLDLSIDKEGLKYTFEAPNTTAGNDLLENIRNGNVKGSSFMFSVKSDSWQSTKGAEIEDRTILEIDQLVELGPVTMPAYPDTTAAKRSFDQFKAENKPVTIEDLKLKRKRFL